MKQLKKTENDIIKAEVNFLQYPIGSLDKKFKGQTIAYRDWEVAGTEKYGLPGPSAVELDNVITKLIQDKKRKMNGIVPKWIKVTDYELAKEIGNDTSGKVYKRLKKDLMKLATLSIVSRGAFKKKGQSLPFSGVFRKYQAIVFRGETAPEWVPETEKRKDGLVDHIYILLGDIYWESLRVHFTKPINYDFMMSLGNPTLERIYQLLSLGFQTRMKEDCLNYNYQEFCGRLPIKSWDVVSVAKQKLKDPLDKMAKSGYLASYDFQFQGEKDRWFIRFYPGAKAIEELGRIKDQKGLFNNLKSQNLLKLPATQNIPYSYKEEDRITIDDVRELKEKLKAHVVREEPHNPYISTDIRNIMMSVLKGN